MLRLTMSYVCYDLLCRTYDLLSRTYDITFLIFIIVVALIQLRTNVMSDLQHVIYAMDK